MQRTHLRRELKDDDGEGRHPWEVDWSRGCPLLMRPDPNLSDAIKQAPRHSMRHAPQ